MRETLRNAWKIADLRKKILYTLFMLLIYRLLCFIPTPGIDAASVTAAVSKHLSPAGLHPASMTGSDIGAATPSWRWASLPTSMRRIIMQLLCVAIPKLEELQKEGEEGQQEDRADHPLCHCWSGLPPGCRALTYGLKAATDTNWYDYVTIGICLAAGTALAMWIGERITEKGIGNGISLLIFAGIISRMSAYIVSYGKNVYS